jgi:hypothetical protein
MPLKHLMKNDSVKEPTQAEPEENARRNWKLASRHAI